MYSLICYICILFVTSMRFGSILKMMVMMIAEMSDLNPVAIILVTSGTRGDRLLFRYPFEETENLQTSAPLCPTKPRVHNPYAQKISEDRLNSNPNKASAQLIRNGVLVGFEDRTLANLLAVKTTLCGSEFTVKIDDVRFVGFPIQIEHQKYLPTAKQQSQVWI